MDYVTELENRNELLTRNCLDLTNKLEFASDISARKIIVITFTFKDGFATYCFIEYYRGISMIFTDMNGNVTNFYYDGKISTIEHIITYLKRFRGIALIRIENRRFCAATVDSSELCWELNFDKQGRKWRLISGFIYKKRSFIKSSKPFNWNDVLKEYSK